MPLLAAHHHVIAVDLRGAGDSDAPPSGYDKRTLAQDVHAVVATLGQQRLALVGHDIGAAVAYAYANQFPDDVTKLVVIDGPIPGLKGWAEVRAQRWHFGFHDQPGLAERLVTGREYEYFSWFFGNAYQKDAITEADARVYARAYARPASLHAGFEYYRAFEQDAADNQRVTLPLKMPVLALAGEQSAWKTLMADQLEGRATTLEGAVVPASGHFVPEEQPGLLVDRLRQFIDAPDHGQ
jgi:pimeloyl-ACP methyl ester carboxylesterase